MVSLIRVADNRRRPKRRVHRFWGYLGTGLVEIERTGGYLGLVDGILGPASRTALQNFKLSQGGLRYDDEWDSRTQEALMGG